MKMELSFVMHYVCVALCLCLEKKETRVVLFSGSSSYYYIIIHYYYQRGILVHKPHVLECLTFFTVSSTTNEQSHKPPQKQ